MFRTKLFEDTFTSLKIHAPAQNDTRRNLLAQTMGKATGGKLVTICNILKSLKV
jgi:hypothetical protein